jgi:hypothetical protein
MRIALEKHGEQQEGQPFVGNDQEETWREFLTIRGTAPRRLADERDQPWALYRVALGKRTPHGLVSTARRQRKSIAAEPVVRTVPVELACSPAVPARHTAVPTAWECSPGESPPQSGRGRRTVPNHPSKQVLWVNYVRPDNICLNNYCLDR